MAIRPFQLPYSDAALKDLHDRLGRTRWPDTVTGSGWTHGFDLELLQRICGYWRETFNWKAEIERLSHFDHFEFVSGRDTIHFIHQKGRRKGAIPILLLHGWPGSFLEMLKLVPMLTASSLQSEDGESFDVIVPSLPGFGFSSRPTAPGMTTSRMADMLADLMSHLGYARFAAHGGDFGAGVSSWLARRYPERVIGIHLNYIPGSYLPGLAPDEKPSEEEERFLREAEQWDERWGAYAHLQQTTPLTAAYGLNDSPSALAAWILEKFRDWADCDGDLATRFTWDELLSNVTLYWMTETIHASCRLYFENRRLPLHLAPGERISVPCGIAHFPKEAPFPPRSWIERGYNVLHWSEMPSGGHFAALEEPEALAEDICNFFRKLSADPPAVRESREGENRGKWPEVSATRVS